MRMKQLFTLMLTICSFVLFSQTIKGKVTDESGQPVIGATVVVQNTSKGTITDVDGNYEIQASSGDVLEISFTGYKSTTITVGSSSTVDVSLAQGALLEEVVVVGYGIQRKVTVTGALASVKGAEIVQSPAVDLTNSLSGRLPGLVVIQTSGEPGQDAARVRIRGTNTLGNSSPLIVIDGIPDRDGGFGRLNPQDIENITVLKDAAAAIYGARAANGAIIVTTKRGKSGKPTINYGFNYGNSQPTVVPKMSNAVEYANIMNQLGIYRNIPVNEWGNAWNAISTNGSYASPTAGVRSITAQYSPANIKKHGDGSDPWNFPDTDWFGGSFKTWAPQLRQNLDMSGGNESVNYFASLGYVHQDAIYRNSATFFNQYSFRTNLDAKINEHVKTNLGVQLRRDDRNYPTESAGAIFRMLMRGRPVEHQVWPNGKPGPDIENGQNPYVITTNATGFLKNPEDFIQLNGGVDLTNPWIKGLKLSLSAAVDTRNGNSKEWRTPWQLWFKSGAFEADGKTPVLAPSVRSTFTDPRLTQRSYRVLNTNLTGLLNYDVKLNDAHTISAMLGVTQERFEGSNFLAFRRNYISPALDQLFAGGSLDQNTDGSGYERARLGYYGRAQYNFREKYLAEFIWRYDGSYIFPKDTRFGFFPGLLLGWNVTEEDFFKVDGLDRLKLRASYGLMGNDQVFFNNQLQEFAFLSSYGFDQYPVGNVVQTTLREVVLANPDFTWERARNLNFGVDATLFDKLDVTLEVFSNKRDRILIQETGSTPQSSGISSLLPPVNKGKVNNGGFEYSLTYNNFGAQNFKWSAGINGGYAKNKVVFLDEEPGLPEYQKVEGKPIGAYLVYQSDGVFKTQADIEANKLDYSNVTNKLLPGDMKFVDHNNDGKINADDRVRIDANSEPTFFFGGTFNAQFKNFDLAMLLQGSTGARIRVQTESGDIGNYLKYQFDNRWSIENPSDEHPRLASRGDTYFTGGAYGNNTYFLFSKDYLRLKNIEIGYTIKGGIKDKIGLKGLRVYANGLNVFTVDKNGIFDPEAENQAGTSYPLSRVINFGFNVSF
jgi:TonB-dependent starch-binding outer membrane protein SusC